MYDSCRDAFLFIMHTIAVERLQRRRPGEGAGRTVEGSGRFGPRLG